MDVVSVTVGLSVSDLAGAVEWYRKALQLPDPELAPVDGVVEFRSGQSGYSWAKGSTTRSGAGVVIRLGVDDTSKQRERVESAGIVVGPLEDVPGVIEYLDFADPGWHMLSFYRELG